MEPKVLSGEDFAHATGAEAPDDSVMLESLTKHRQKPLPV
jgi:hypothetical protein